MKTSSQMGQDKSEIPKQYDFYSGSGLGGSVGSGLSIGSYGENGKLGSDTTV